MKSTQLEYFVGEGVLWDISWYFNVWGDLLQREWKALFG